MCDSAGGAGGVGGNSGSSGAGEAKGASSAGESCASNAEASSAVDGAMSDVSKSEVCTAADSVCSADGYQGPSSQQEAGICIGTESECAKEFADRAQRQADQMTEEQAVKALDGSFLHDPRSLTPAEVKGLEALSRAQHLSDEMRHDIRSFLDDHYNGIDSLGFNGQMGRFDSPR